MKCRRKNLLGRIPRALYGRFDPYVFTFNLETETCFYIDYFLIINVSQIYICVALQGHDVLASMQKVISSMISSNATIKYHAIFLNNTISNAKGA